jgi:protein-S-isoprenylcysteine O-methyltransferase Ste14
VWLYLRGKPYAPIAFRTPGPYRWIRHPLYVGWFLAFWATPTMTVTHLVFAVMTAGYILTAIQLEERDLIDAYGDTYRRYREEVPMLIPGLGQRERGTAMSPAADGGSRSRG